jgi:hypothetical protein
MVVGSSRSSGAMVGANPHRCAVAFPAADATVAAKAPAVVLHNMGSMRGARRSSSRWEEEKAVRGGAAHRGSGGLAAAVA